MCQAQRIVLAHAAVERAAAVCGVSKLAEAEKSMQEVHEDGMQDTDKNERKAQNNVLRTESNCNLE